MDSKTYLHVTKTIFGIIALLHLLRIIFGWGAVIGSVVIPLWLSILAFIVAGYLSYSGYRLSKK